MKTRSQTRKEKHDHQKRKVPQLNEDVLGIILQHVMRKEQEYVSETNSIVLDHFWYARLRKRQSSNDIEWPDYLNSNSRRLVHHTYVKLFPGYTLAVNRHISFHKHVNSKRDLDILWKTLRHYGAITLQNNVFGEDCEDDHDIMTPAEFFRRLWDWIRPTSSLIRELKIRLN